MKKILFIITLVCQLGSLYAQKEGIVVDDRPLTWKDFKGKPTTDVYKAKTYTYLGYQGKMTSGKFTYEVTFYFNPKLSWVDKDYLKKCTEEQSNYLLKHEQGHYDIASVIAREADKALADFNYSEKRALVQADSIFRSYIKKTREVQDAYDKDTNHSKVVDQQRRWNDKIEEALKKGYIDLL